MTDNDIRCLQRGDPDTPCAGESRWRPPIASTSTEVYRICDAHWTEIMSAIRQAHLDGLLPFSRLNHPLPHRG